MAFITLVRADSRHRVAVNIDHIETVSFALEGTEPVMSVYFTGRQYPTEFVPLALGGALDETTRDFKTLAHNATAELNRVQRGGVAAR